MIYLDIETLDFFSDPHIKALPRPVQLGAMRFGMAVTYDSQSGAWASYWASEPIEVADIQHAIGGEQVLASLWDSLIGQSVVGWNIADFDIPLLMLHLHADGDRREPWRDQMRIVDLMALAKQASKTFGRERWYSLRDVAAANGMQKTASGDQAALWLRSDDPELHAQAAAYCRNDVQLCIDLFALAQGAGLLLPARPERGERGDLRLWLDAEGQIRECLRVEE